MHSGLPSCCEDCLHVRAERADPRVRQARRDRWTAGTGCTSRSGDARVEARGVEQIARSLFTFCNQRRNRIRCLFFDGSGFWLATERLEGPTYQWPKDPAAVMQMSVAQLRLLLEGFELKSRRGWRRYEHRLAPGSPSAEAIATRSLKTTVDPQ